MNNNIELGIQFVETDPKKILDDMIVSYERFSERKLYPADPMRIHLAWEANIVSQERVNINKVANQNILRYARSENLDNLAFMLKDAKRLEAEAAKTIIEFQLSKNIEKEMLVSKGTRVALNGDLIFATTRDLIIKAHDRKGVVEAVCQTKGTVGNGFLPGQISQAVDIFPYLDSVKNITQSGGGADRESDADFYERIVSGAKSYSVAGPSGAYEYFAKSASALISDAKAISEEPAKVDIRILLKDGELPTNEIIRKIEDYLSDEKKRPLTDKVTVLPPDVVEYEIDLTYYLKSASSAKEIKKNIDLAIIEYKKWQSEKIGRDINPSYLTALLIEAGAKRVEITKPIYRKVDNKSVAILRANNVEIVNGGFESE